MTIIFRTKYIGTEIGIQISGFFVEYLYFIKWSSATFNKSSSFRRIKSASLRDHRINVILFLSNGEMPLKEKIFIWKPTPCVVGIISDGDGCPRLSIMHVWYRDICLLSHVIIIRTTRKNSCCICPEKFHTYNWFAMRWDHGKSFTTFQRLIRHLQDSYRRYCLPCDAQ